MKYINKRFIVFMLFVSLLVTNISQRAAWASAKSATKKYYVKEKYLRDIGKKFKVLKKKNAWTLKNGECEHAAQYSYRMPKKNIWYTFQGDSSAESWKMKNNAKCIYISMKVGTLVKGFKGKMKIDKFVSKLYSKKKKAKWSMGVLAHVFGEEAISITFYAKNGKKYRLDIPVESKEKRWISANDRVQIIRIAAT